MDAVTTSVGSESAPTRTLPAHPAGTLGERLVTATCCLQSTILTATLRECYRLLCGKKSMQIAIYGTVSPRFARDFAKKIRVRDSLSFRELQFRRKQWKRAKQCNNDDGYGVAESRQLPRRRPAALFGPELNPTGSEKTSLKVRPVPHAFQKSFLLNIAAFLRLKL